VRAFVTGATGFIGGHLVDALRARGDEITALVRDPGRAREIARRGAHIVVGGLGAGNLRELMAGHDIAYHLAGLVAGRNEAEFLATNQGGTAQVVAAAQAADVSRFVLVSSLAAGGPSTPGTPLNGSEPPRPVTQYGRSKLAAEVVVRESDLEWTVLRPPAVYGPGDREMLRLFKAAATGLAPVFGHGSQPLSLVFGPDLAAGIVAAGATEKTRGGIYYAAHPEVLTARQLVESVGRAIGKRVRVVAIPRWVGRMVLRATDLAARLANRATVLSVDKAEEFFAPAWVVDSSSLTEATGWSAHHAFEDGARLTAEWYRERGWL